MRIAGLSAIVRFAVVEAVLLGIRSIDALRYLVSYCLFGVILYVLQKLGIFETTM